MIETIGIAMCGNMSLLYSNHLACRPDNQSAMIRG